MVSRMFFLRDDDSTLLLTSLMVWDGVSEVSSGVGWIGVGVKVEKDVGLVEVVFATCDLLTPISDDVDVTLRLLDAIDGEISVDNPSLIDA